MKTKTLLKLSVIDDDTFRLENETSLKGSIIPRDVIDAWVKRVSEQPTIGEFGQRHLTHCVVEQRPNIAAALRADRMASGDSAFTHLARYNRVDPNNAAMIIRNPRMEVEGDLHRLVADIDMRVREVPGYGPSLRCYSSESYDGHTLSQIVTFDYAMLSNPEGEPQLKHQEHIFTIPASIVPTADETEMAPLTFTSDDIFIGKRAGLESNSMFRQILPYILIECNGKLFTYQRSKGIGEERLLGKVSVGLGGHIDLADIEYCGDSGALEWDDTYSLALVRELMEEILPTNVPADCPVVEIQPGSWNNTDEGLKVLSMYRSAVGESIIPHGEKINAEGGVEQFHLGCPYIFSVDSEDWTTAEDQLIFQGFFTADEVLEQFDVERWTDILLRNYIAARDVGDGSLTLIDWFKQR